MSAASIRRKPGVRLWWRHCRAALLLVLVGAGCAAGDPLEIRDARVRELIPGQDKTAGYFTAHNTSAADIVLIGASSPAARSVEMHMTTHEDGVARMRRLQQVVIAPGETVRFEPGGRHLMLFGVSQTGEAMDVVLRTAEGTELPVRFEIVGLGADDARGES